MTSEQCASVQSKTKEWKLKKVIQFLLTPQKPCKELSILLKNEETEII